MINLKQSRVDLWNTNLATFRTFCTWDSDDRILRKCGITKGNQSEEVSRITKNRARLDNTSVGRLTSYGCVSDEAFELVIGIRKPWKLKKFEAGPYPEADDFRELPVRGEIRITLDIERTMYPCPNCRTYCKVHEYETRSYSHPRIMRMATTIVALIPKLRCDVCDGYPQMAVPWARPHVSYTKMMEVEVFLLLQDMPVHETAVHCDMTDGVVWDMVRYRVGQALIRMDLSGVFLIYVDETSSKKGHNYITVVCDQDRRIIFMCEGKGSDTMDRLAEWLREHNGEPDNILYVCCDLGEAYPCGVRRNFQNASIVYDHFHAVKLIDDALDAVILRAIREENLKAGLRTKLRMNESRFSDDEKRALESTIGDFRELSENYRLKNVFTNLYNYQDKRTAEAVLDLWYTDVMNLGSPEMKVAANSIMERREGIMRWFDTRISNGFAEGINSLIQTTKRVARGYRNIENFIAMVYLRNGHLIIDFD